MMFRRKNCGDIVAKQVHEPLLPGAGQSPLAALKI
jgi:hypothetical protein